MSAILKKDGCIQYPCKYSFTVRVHRSIYITVKSEHEPTNEEILDWLKSERGLRAQYDAIQSSETEVVAEIVPAIK